MSVRVSQRKDKSGWWVFISYRGKRMKKSFPDGKVGEKAARTFAEKLLAKMKWAEMPLPARTWRRLLRIVCSKGKLGRRFVITWLHCVPLTSRRWSVVLSEPIQSPVLGSLFGEPRGASLRYNPSIDRRPRHYLRKPLRCRGSIQRSSVFSVQGCDEGN